jgi:O-antigen ligase
MNKINKTLLMLYSISVFSFVDSPKLIFISQALFLILLVGVIISLIYNKKIKTNYTLFGIALFITSGIISTLGAIDVELSFIKIITLIQLLVLYILFNNGINVKSKVDVFFLYKVILYSGVFMIVYSMFFYGVTEFINSIFTGARLGGEINQINTYGVYSVVSLTVGLFLWLNTGKIYYLILTVIPLIGIITSGSRKSLLIIPVILVCLLLAKYGIKRLYKSFLYLLFFTLISFIVVSYVLPEDILYRIDRLFEVFNNGDIDNSTFMRQLMITSGFRYFLNKPVFGYGLNNFSILFAKSDLGRLTYAHNNYIELLVNTGFIGTFIYYSIFINLFFLSYKKYKLLGYDYALVPVLLIIYMLLDIGMVSYYDKLTFIILGISSSILMSKIRRLD